MPICCSTETRANCPDPKCDGGNSCRHCYCDQAQPVKGCVYVCPLPLPVANGERDTAEIIPFRRVEWPGDVEETV